MEAYAVYSDLFPERSTAPYTITPSKTSVVSFVHFRASVHAPILEKKSIIYKRETNITY